MTVPNSENWLDAVLPDSGNVAIDVGANVGEWTNWLANRFSYVIAIEPHPEAFRNLKEKDLSNVEYINAAAWSSDDDVSMNYFTSSQHTSIAERAFSLQADEKQGAFIAKGMTLDSLDSYAGKIDFIKIDVEMAEKEVLLGATNILKHHKPDLIVEVHSVHNHRWIMEELPEYGYEMIRIRHPHYSKGTTEWDQHLWIYATQE